MHLVAVAALVCILADPASAGVLWGGSGDPAKAGLSVHDPSGVFRFDHDHAGPQPGVLHQDTLASAALGGSIKLPPEQATAELK